MHASSRYLRAAACVVVTLACTGLMMGSWLTVAPGSSASYQRLSEAPRHMQASLASVLNNSDVSYYSQLPDSIEEAITVSGVAHCRAVVAVAALLLLLAVGALSHECMLWSVRPCITLIRAC